MFPSIATMALRLVIAAVLVAPVWYVWRTAPVLPYPLVASGPRMPAIGKQWSLKRLPGEHGVAISGRSRERTPQPDSATKGNEHAAHI
jgi:hypothetical protein